MTETYCRRCSCYLGHEEPLPGRPQDLCNDCYDSLFLQGCLLWLGLTLFLLLIFMAIAIR